MDGPEESTQSKTTDGQRQEGNQTAQTEGFPGIEENISDVAKAKELLNSNDSSKKEEAIASLIDASKQGSQEATNILSTCLDERDGITTENESDVEWCVKTPDEEKRLRYAVEKLYSLMKKEGKDTVALQDIDEALKRAEGKLKVGTHAGDADSSSDKVNSAKAGLVSLLKNSLSVGEQDEFTLKEFMDTAMAYARGDVPEVITVLDKEDMEKFNKASVLEKVVKYPQQSFESLKHFILVKMSKQGSNLVKSMIPTSQIQMLFMLYIYSQLTTEFAVFFVPLVIFYIAFISLVVFSLQMFYGSEAFRQLRSVSQLMKKFDPRLDNKEAERKFIWKSVTPYISFFITLLIIVAVFPLCDKNWIPCSELCLLSLVFTVSSFRGLPAEYDNYALYTILLKILTVGIRNLENVRGLWILCHTFLSVPLPYGLEMQLSVPSLLHIIILTLLVIMAGRHSWRGIYRVLIPHVVCLLWWQLFTELFVFTSWRGLLHATVGWVIFVTMLPMLFLFTVGLFVAYSLQWFLTLDFALKLAVSALVIAGSSTVFYYSKLEIPHGKKLQENKKAVTLIMGLVVVCLSVPVVYVNFVPSTFGARTTLSWYEYSKWCGVARDQVIYRNKAEMDIKCYEFHGELVNWTGTVKYVKLLSVENRFRSLVNALPTFIRPTAKCLLGSEESSDAESGSETSSWLARQKGPCKLNSFDKYTFAVGVKMDMYESRPSVQLTVTHRYYRTMVSLRRGTEITFEGRLESGLGATPVIVLVKRLFIGGKKVKPSSGLGRDDVFEGLRDVSRYSAQFFMAPLVNQRKEDVEEDEVYQRYQVIND